MLLLQPPVGVATADAYRWLSDARGTMEPSPRVLTPARLTSWADVAELAENDFEAPVTQHVPAVAVLGDARPMFAPPMPAGVVPPIYGMSGSGSTWFLVLTDHRVEFTVGEAEGWRASWTSTAERVVDVERIG